MNYRNFIRVQLALVAFGVALVLASPVRAQQETDPTTFDVNPRTPQLVVASAQTQAAVIPSGNVQLAAIQHATEQQATSTLPVQNADVSVSLQPKDFLLMVICIGSSWLLALGAIRFERRRRPLSGDAPSI